MTTCLKITSTPILGQNGGGVVDLMSRETKNVCINVTKCIH